MRIAALVVFFALAGCVVHERAGRVAIDFEGSTLGKAPEGFTAVLSGKGREGSWAVREDPTSPAGANVLVQTDADNTGYRFPLCIYEKLMARDVDVSVAFKPLSGERDQAAGIVWRYINRDNYYIARANALENNVVAYKVDDGMRSDLKLAGKPGAYGLKAPVPATTWSTLRVVARGNEFTIYLNGKRLFDVEDQTFTEAGKVGLWTKADSVTEFDDFRIKSLDAR